MLTNQELTRYRRQISLAEVGVGGQHKLKAASVLIIGAGGLGAPIILYLAAAGIGKIAICDGDVVELSNLHRQVIYTEREIGLSKAAIAAQRAKELNSDIECVSINQPFTENSVGLVQDYDVVIDGSDNFTARYLANQAAVKYGKPLISASLFKFSGQVGLFNHNGSACYQCLYPIPPSDEDVPNCNEAGVIGAVAGVLGSLAASETIKLILNAVASTFHPLVVFDSVDLNFKKYQIDRDKDCACCSGQAALIPRTLNPASSEDVLAITAAELKKLQSAASVILIDVRTNLERTSLGCIAGDIHIPIENIAKAPIENADQAPIVVYCQHGIRSQVAALQLRNRGFAKVYSLEGGIESWLDSQSRDLNG